MEAEGVGLAVEAGDSTKRSEYALPFRLTLVHGVLKWLQYPLVKNVMLRHVVDALHNFLHSSMSETFPGDESRYTSPASVSHSDFGPTSCHERSTPPAIVTNAQPTLRRDNSDIKAFVGCARWQKQLACFADVWLESTRNSLWTLCLLYSHILLYNLKSYTTPTYE